MQWHWSHFSSCIGTSCRGASFKNIACTVWIETSLKCESDFINVLKEYGFENVGYAGRGCF